MKVAIAGYGVEGKASYAYWHQQGAEVTIADERESVADLPPEASVVFGPEAFAGLGGYDFIIRSPGISPKKLPYGERVWSATNEFFAKCPAPIIGVTGTKGKGTTSSLIAGILQAAGKNVHLVGNIGTPAVTELATIRPDDVVVYELSSYQLWDLKKSPHVAVVLMMEADHLDVHAGMDDYVTAKANIRRHQGLDDYCIYHPTNELSASIATTSDWPQGDARRAQWQEQAVKYGVDEPGSVYVHAGQFMVDGQTVCSIEELRLPGAHNLENACAAIMAARYFTLDNEAVQKGLRGFEGLPHRLKFVAEKEGVKYYDDSIATTPGSALAAMKSFDAPKLLIVGGQDKGADYTELIEACAATDTKLLAIGSNGDVIAELCHQLGVVCERETGDMVAIVAKAHEIAQAGEIVVLSPAAASFDMFSSYVDRGNQFVAAVSSL